MEEESKIYQFIQKAAEADYDEGTRLDSESIYLQNIFPEEIWKLVFKKLLKESPDDFEGLANSSPYFGELLSSQKTVYLFEKAFEIVASTVWKNEGLQGFPVSEVIKCRAVCSKWNEAVDKLIPDKFRPFGKESNHNQFTTIGSAFNSIMKNNCFANFIDEGYTSTNPNKTVGNFLRHFELTHPGNQSNGRDPMILGKLTIFIKAPDDDEDDLEGYHHYLEDIYTLLSKYGSYLHNFLFYFDEENVFEHGARLQEWLRHVPNLKELLFHNEHDLRNAEIDYQENYPFPQFKQLEKLDIQSVPQPVFHQLIMQNCQISSLKLFWNVNYNLETLDLPNLKKLAVGFLSPEIVGKLGSAEVQWPLESLSISFSNKYEDVDYVFAGCAALFQVIQNKFGSTLVKLRLDLCVEDDEARDVMGEDCRNFRLELPNLKKIELDMPRVLICLDFLLHMRNNLEEISVYRWDEFSEMKMATQINGPIVQFIGFEGKLLDSNIWAILKSWRNLRWCGFGIEKRIYRGGIFGKTGCKIVCTSNLVKMTEMFNEIYIFT